MGLSEPINLELAGLPFSGLPFPQAELQLKKILWAEENSMITEILERRKGEGKTKRYGHN